MPNLSQVLVAALSFSGALASTLDLSKYTVTWDQDFTKMSTLSVSDYGPCGEGGTTWMAHTPYGGDWNNFQNPDGDYRPYHLDSETGLTIRAYYDEKSGNYYSGLLASIDKQGRGFSQRFGYFECKAKLSGGAGTWPSFWMDDVDSTVNNMPGHELDVFEQYGISGVLFSTLHYWVEGHDHDGTFATRLACDAADGFHTYGVDLQHDYISFYYDRQMTWQFENKVPGYDQPFNRTMYVMLDNAYGGGVNNSEKYLKGNPQDLQVQYVRVWQGYGGSTVGNDPSDQNQVSFSPGRFTLGGGESIDIKGMSFEFGVDGILRIVKSGNTIWSSSTTTTDCQSPWFSCQARYGGDGDFVLYDTNGHPYWATDTWNQYGSMLLLENQAPYFSVVSGNCSGPIWSTGLKF